MPALISLAFLLGTPPALPADESCCLGTLWDRDEEWQSGNGRPFLPQEGDLVFFSCTSCFYYLTYGAARSGHPWHVGIVVRDRDGDLCLLEAGGLKREVIMTPIEERLPEYLEKRYLRRIWVRRVKQSLTPEQSRCLTSFAEAQEGKRFAPPLRVAMLGVPCRPLRPTDTEQGAWFCAELVSEALRQCGACSAGWMVPEKTTPRDLFTDRRDLSCGWHPAETWSADCDPPPPGPPCAPR